MHICLQKLLGPMNPQPIIAGKRSFLLNFLMTVEFTAIRVKRDCCVSFWLVLFGLSARAKSQKENSDKRAAVRRSSNPGSRACLLSSSAPIAATKHDHRGGMNKRMMPSI